MKMPARGGKGDGGFISWIELNEISGLGFGGGSGGWMESGDMEIYSD